MNMKPHSLSRLAAGVAVVLAASLALPAMAQQGPGGPGGPGGMRGGPRMHDGGGMHHGPHEGGRGGMGMSPRMLDAIKATPEQRNQIRQIMDAARKDMQGQRQARQALKAEASQIFSQPNVDAAAAEALRQKMLAQHDQMSKRRMQAMVEVAKVLTPEQRRQLADLRKRGNEMRERHRKEREALVPGRS
ncbi:MAG: Spy/CpxP family protein refolding chaperone [Rubrivivax sp.]